MIPTQLGYIQSVYNDPTSSDLILRFNDQIFHAHKGVLLASSKTFLCAFRGRFFNAKTWTIKGYSNQATYAMIKHIYGFEHEHPTPKDLNRYLELYRIATEYQVPSFEALVVEGMRKSWFEESCVVRDVEGVLRA